MKIYKKRIGEDGVKNALDLDITVQSSTGLGRLLAPTWEIVLGHKAHNGDSRYAGRKTYTNEQYIEAYIGMLRKRYMNDYAAFMMIVKAESVVLRCYCTHGKFCHRHIAASALVKIANHHGIDAEIVE